MRSFARIISLLCVVASPLASQDTTYKPSTRMPNGRQVVAIYLGATTCGPCMLPEVKSAIVRMKSLVAAQAKTSGAAFAVMGASTDWDPRVGFDFFTDIGPFDQLSVGANWTNFAFEHFVWRQPDVEAAMPQVLVIERTITAGQRGMTFSEPKLLKRIVGGREIPEWVAKGAPIFGDSIR